MPRSPCALTAHRAPGTLSAPKRGPETTAARWRGRFEPMALATSVKLSMASELRLVDLVHEASHKMAELAGFEEDVALNVALAVREAVINAVTHGNRKR